MTADLQLELPLNDPDPDLDIPFHDWITQLHNEQVTKTRDEESENE